MKTKITLGFSPCPNDTFIFDAMIHQKIDTCGLEFEFQFGDVEELNQMAAQSKLDVTKLSFNAFFSVADKYCLLNSGAALGKNNGPLLISKNKHPEKDIPKLKIAIPGRNTTANLLLSVAFPGAHNKIEYLFSDIETAVINGDVDAGLIIHENRFTYSDRGLHKIIDLGEYWEKLTSSPIPLGGIAVKRELRRDLQLKIDKILTNSVRYAFDHPRGPLSFIKAHAQEMDEEVMYKHIKLYVNNFTRDLGTDGKKAVNTLYRKAREMNLVEDINRDLFIDYLYNIKR
ncbi:MAG: 1,4-dihydroxy-6-naphthoate synthase [Bacteroidetes bacterium 4572_114]|nr:MAG: 1,4-dihydroxy-6-naphthoate synthase [Bacteroidetes bacterium 4572_114]